MVYDLQKHICFSHKAITEFVTKHNYIVSHLLLNVATIIRDILLQPMTTMVS